jgi:hypothetical protein
MSVINDKASSDMNQGAIWVGVSGETVDGRPTVMIKVPSPEILVDSASARQMGQNLIRSAEQAETEFWLSSTFSKLGFPAQTVRTLIEAYRNYTDRDELAHLGEEDVYAE